MLLLMVRVRRLEPFLLARVGMVRMRMRVSAFVR